MQLTTLEQDISATLRIPLLLARATGAIPIAELSRAEQTCLARFNFANRRRDWLCGRHALKKLLSALGRTADTSSIEFPDRQLSITHSGDIAIAAGTDADTQGLGIDYEPLRAINERVARWFLDDAEIDWLNHQPASCRTPHIIRLWTIKEAAFKSHPHNHDMTLGEFAIGDPAEQPINTVTTTSAANISVASRRFSRGYLSIATLQDLQRMGRRHED